MDRAMIRSLAAEIGRAGFIASSVLALISPVMEYRLPGTFFSYIAPQHLAAVLVVCGILALLDDRVHWRGFRSIVLLAAVAAAVTIAVVMIAGSYLAPLGIEGRRLAIACGIAALLPFFLFRRFGADDR
jgi:hypothetical protein